MEPFSDAFRQARDKVKIADYGLTKILQLSRDPNVVRSAIQNLHDAQVRGIDAVLLFERTYKRVPAYPVGHLETKLRLFSDYCVKRYKLSEDIVKDIRLVAEWVAMAKQKAPSITADSRLVFSDGGYQVSHLPLSAVKSMVVKTTSFIDAVEKVVQDARSP